jgi:GNAT superfamily N-acetyltransferase
MGTQVQVVTYSFNYIDTPIFEEEYEEELREDEQTRRDIISNGLVVYMWLDETLIGECYGITPYEYAYAIDQGQGFYDEEDAISDVDMSDRESVYVWSTTILPQYQGGGYGRKLREEFARYASEKGYAKLVGHATTQTMVHIARSQGAIFHLKGIHEEWFGTKRTAHFYTQFLPQTKDWNCGPTALAYLLEMKEHTYGIHTLEVSLHSNPEEGTSPANIKKFLEYKKIPFKEMRKELVPNSIIDITVDGDGHWITLIKKTEKMADVWWVFDAWPGEGYKVIDEKYLMENWHSPRYGKYCGYTLL